MNEEQPAPPPSLRAVPHLLQQAMQGLTRIHRVEHHTSGRRYRLQQEGEKWPGGRTATEGGIRQREGLMVATQCALQFGSPPS